MNTISTVTVFAAILLPAVLYFWLALRERPNVKSIRDFFPLTRFLEGEEYGRSTAAAGVSLATVILTLVNLSPIFGISLLVTIFSYALSFVVLYFCARRILRANPRNETVQSFLGRTYESQTVRNVALLFSFVGYISIFSMELIVGVTVLQPFLGEQVLAFSVVYLVFIIAYSIISGFRAIVATEQWQIRFIIAAVLVLVAFLGLMWSNVNPTPSFIEITKSVWSSWNAPWVFLFGIAVMNLPAPISDSGTWQRLCSTASETDARRGLLKAIPMFILIWGTLIVFGCYIAQVAITSGSFDPRTTTLMTHLVATLASGGLLSLILLFVLMLGLFAAMITTADSLLIVAAQMFAIDLLKLDADEIKPANAISRARLTLALIALASFALFVLFHFLKFDVVQLIFAIYGAQLAMFPPVAAALFLDKRMDFRRASLAAILALVGGFTGAWAAAFYGKYGGNPNWLYNAPVVALLGSSLLFLLFSVTAWRREETD